MITKVDTSFFLVILNKFELLDYKNPHRKVKLMFWIRLFSLVVSGSIYVVGNKEGVFFNWKFIWS